MTLPRDSSFLLNILNICDIAFRVSRTGNGERGPPSMSQVAERSAPEIGIGGDGHSASVW